MNSWTLELRSPELEEEFVRENNKVSFSITKIVMVTVLLTSLFQIIVVFLENTHPISVMLYFFFYFLAGIICLCLSYANIRLFNYSIFIVLISFGALIVWSNMNADLIKFFLYDTTITPFVRGFYLSLSICSLLLGSNVRLKILYLCVLLCMVVFSSSQKPIIDSLKILPTIIALSFKVYSEDKQKRSTFLLQKKDLIWDYLVDFMLPNSLILTKYNESTNKFELFSQNKQARDEFGIQNTEQFHQFCRHVVLNSYSQHREMKAKLEKCREPVVEDTLYGQVLMQFDKEINKRKAAAATPNNGSSEAQRERRRTTQLLKKRNTKDEEATGLVGVSSSKTPQETGTQSGIPPTPSSAQKQRLKTPTQEQKSSFIQRQSWGFMRNTSTVGEGRTRVNSHSITNPLQYTGNDAKSAGVPLTSNNSTSSNHNKRNSTLHENGMTGSVKEGYNNQQDNSDDDGVNHFQGHLVSEQYIPVPNKKFSVRIISFYLNEYFTVISIQRDEFREKLMYNIDESNKATKIIEESFQQLNVSSVSQFRTLKDIYVATTQDTLTHMDNDQSIGVGERLPPSSKEPVVSMETIRELLHSSYAAKQQIYNTLEWMNRKKKAYSEQRMKFNLQEMMLGLNLVFESALKQKFLKLSISVQEQIMKSTLYSDPRVLNQMLFNLLNFAIDQSEIGYSLSDSIAVEVAENPENQSLIRFQINFTASKQLNLSYLNCAELDDDVEVNYAEYLDVKVSKHILKFINPYGSITFGNLPSNKAYSITFYVNILEQITQEATCAAQQHQPYFTNTGNVAATPTGNYSSAPSNNQIEQQEAKVSGGRDARMSGKKKTTILRNASSSQPGNLLGQSSDPLKRASQFSRPQDGLLLAAPGGGGGGALIGAQQFSNQPHQMSGEHLSLRHSIFSPPSANGLNSNQHNGVIPYTQFSAYFPDSPVNLRYPNEFDNLNNQESYHQQQLPMTNKRKISDNPIPQGSPIQYNSYSQRRILIESPSNHTTQKNLEYQLDDFNQDHSLLKQQKNFKLQMQAASAQYAGDHRREYIAKQSAPQSEQSSMYSSLIQISPQLQSVTELEHATGDRKNDMPSFSYHLEAMSVPQFQVKDHLKVKRLHN